MKVTLKNALVVALIICATPGLAAEDTGKNNSRSQHPYERYFSDAEHEVLKTEVDELQQQPQLVRYLSDMEKGMIAHQIALESGWDQYDATVSEALEGEGYTLEISFPVSFTPIKPKSDTGRSVQAAVTDSGDITCSITAHYPHIGSGPFGNTVKAKSSGSCTYKQVSGTTPPPSITYDLQQYLLNQGTGAWVTESYPRTGLNVSWSDSSAQVFWPNCVNGGYVHGDFVYITPPAGWVYSGPQPWVFPPPDSVLIVNC